jgi:hypothetical protein
MEDVILKMHQLFKDRGADESALQILKDVSDVSLCPTGPS